MAITYNAGSNTITVTGGTLGSPITPEDIYQADQAGGPWGVVSKIVVGNTISSQDIECIYIIDANFVLGDAGGTTTWYDSSQQMVIYRGDTQPIVYQYASNCHWISGELGATGRGKKGGIIVGCISTVDYDNWMVLNGEVKWYGAVYVGATSSSGGGGPYSTHIRWDNSCDATLKDVKFVGIWRMRVYGTVNLEDIEVIPADYSSFSFEFYSAYITVNRLRIAATYTTHYFYALNQTITYRDLYMPEGTVGISNWAGSHKTLTLVDPMAAAFFVGHHGGCPSADLLLKYRFNLKVTDRDGSPIVGALVTLTDATGAVTYSGATDGVGEIPEQELSHVMYGSDYLVSGYNVQYTIPPDTPDHQTDYSPYTLQIEKSGYRTYLGEFDIDEPKAMTISLPDSGGGPPGAVVEVTDTTATVTCPSTTAVVEVKES